MKKFLDWVVFGPDERDARSLDEGFREAPSSSGRPTEDDEFGEEFHRAIRRRNATYPTTESSRRLDASGGGLIDLQVGSRVFNDVPAKMRSELWMSKLHSSASVASLSSPLASYEDCLGREVDENVLQEIEKDIHRTFPGHVTLTSPAGQRAMRDVLRAYASYDPEVGYSQGMNFIVGLLLTYLTPRHAFAALLLIMSERGLREYYLQDGMVHLQARLWQLGKLIDDELARHLEEHMVLPVLYASSWQMTCFAAEFPLKFSARVMDCLITDSFELPIMKVSVSILKRCRDEILQMDDMEDIIGLLRKTVPGWPERRLMDLLTESLSVPWTAREMAVLQEERMVESVADAVRRIGGEDQSDEGGGRGAGEAWEPDWEAAEYPNMSTMGSAATGATLTPASTQRMSPFQSGMASGDLIDVSGSGEDARGDEGDERHATKATLKGEGSMLHLLQSFAHMDVSGATGTASLNHQLRDIVFSSSFNYGASGGSPDNNNSSTGVDDETAPKEDEFGEWEG